MPDFSFDIAGSWIFTVVYLIFSYGIWFIFPHYVQLRYSSIPKIKYINFLYVLFYWIFIVLSFFVPLQIGFYFYLALIFYLSGLAMYLSSLYYFAINEPDKPVTKGIYRYFKHPSYLGFSLIMFGIALSGQNVFLGFFALLISILSYIVAKHEERWCIEAYGDEYKEYLKACFL